MGNLIDNLKILQEELKELSYDKFAILNHKTGSAKDFSKDYLKWRNKLENALNQLDNKKAIASYEAGLLHQDVDANLVKLGSYEKATDFFYEALDAALKQAQKNSDEEKRKKQAEEQRKQAEEQKNIIPLEKNKRKEDKTYHIYVSYGGDEKYLNKIKEVLEITLGKIKYNFIEPLVSENDNSQLPIMRKLVEKIHNSYDKEIESHNCDGAIFYITDKAYTQAEGENGKKNLTSESLLEIGGIVASYPKKYILIIDGDLELPDVLSEISNKSACIKFNTGNLDVPELKGLKELLKNRIFVE